MKNMLTGKCYDDVKSIVIEMRVMLCELDGRNGVDLSVLLNDIAAQVMEQPWRYSEAYRAGASESWQNASYSQFVLDYFQFVQENKRSYGNGIYPLRGHQMDLGKACEMFGNEKPFPDTKSATVSTAIECAEWNMWNARSCLVALYFLSSLSSAKGHRDRVSGKQTAVDACIEEAREWLIVKAQRFEASLMRLSIVQGDLQQLQSLRERIFERTFASNIEVMHNFERGGLVSSYATKRDEQMRADALKVMERKLGA